MSRDAEYKRSHISHLPPLNPQYAQSKPIEAEGAARLKTYTVTFDIFFMEGNTVKAKSKKEAIEIVMDEVSGQYPQAELTIYEAYEEKE